MKKLKFIHIQSKLSKYSYYSNRLIDNTIWIVPLYSWYEPNFRAEDGDIYLEELKGCELNGWSDFMLCKWPSSILDGKAIPKLNGESLELKCHLKASVEINNYFINYNKQFLPTDFQKKPIISFSHFLPHYDLLPPTEFLHFKHLSHVSGSIKLFNIIKEIKPIVHVFGHSHINYNKTIDEIQFIQVLLLYLYIFIESVEISNRKEKMGRSRFSIKTNSFNRYIINVFNYFLFYWIILYIIIIITKKHNYKQ